MVLGLEENRRRVIGCVYVAVCVRFGLFPPSSVSGKRARGEARRGGDSVAVALVPERQHCRGDTVLVLCSDVWPSRRDLPTLP